MKEHDRSPYRQVLNSTQKPRTKLFELLSAAVSVAMISAQAQTYTNLHAFTAPTFNSSVGAATNVDGMFPNGGLVLSSNALYGTTWEAGANGNGTLYSVQTDGSHFTTVHTFSSPYVTPLNFINGDGAKPQQTLALQSNVLYGTTSEGGPGGYGTVFKVNTDGTGFTNLYYFRGGSDGINPQGGVVVVGNTVYGSTTGGGTVGAGTVYRVNTDGSGYKIMHNFSGAATDGGIGVGGLVQSNGMLYGTTRGGGGTNGHGVVFALSTNANGTAAGYSNLYVFHGNPTPGNVSSNNEGASPEAGVVLSGDTLYGTTSAGGTNGAGLVFSIRTDGTHYTALHIFSYANPNGANTNSDGSDPLCALALSGNTLYGTAGAGGTNGNGTVFAVNTDGSGFTNLYTFRPIVTFVPTFMNIGGSAPEAGVVIGNGALYGTTAVGGPASGNVYGLILSSSGSVPVPIPLKTHLSGGSLVLSWNGADFSLYSTPSLDAPFIPVPGATNPYTIPTTNSQRFFRLQASQ
jgi:uncharacterized repeat protein (TIGR03803 family)